MKIQQFKWKPESKDHSTQKWKRISLKLVTSRFLARFKTLMQRSANLMDKNNNKYFLYFVTILFQEKKIFLLALFKFQASGSCFLFNLPGERG